MIHAVFKFGIALTAIASPGLALAQSQSAATSADLNAIWSSEPSSRDVPDFRALHKSVTAEVRDAKWAESQEARIRKALTSNPSIMHATGNLTINCRSTVCEVILILPESYVSTESVSSLTYHAFAEEIYNSSYSKSIKPKLSISGTTLLAYVY